MYAACLNPEILYRSTECFRGCEWLWSVALIGYPPLTHSSGGTKCLFHLMGALSPIKLSSPQVWGILEERQILFLGFVLSM